MEPSQIIRTWVSKKGRKVVFRYPNGGDFDAVWNFACELVVEDTFVELSGKPPAKDEEKAWFEGVLDAIKSGSKIHVSVLVDGTYAGNGEVRRGKNRHYHVGEIGLSLSPAYRDEGIGTELLKALIDESKRLGLRLLTINCFENNPRALHVYKKLGFTTLGILPAGIAFQGSYVGEVKLYLTLTE